MRLLDQTFNQGHYSQWSNEKGELLILFAGLGLFTYVLDYDQMPEGLRQWHLQAEDADGEAG